MNACALFLMSAVFCVASPAPDEVKTKDGKEYKNLKLVNETPTHATFADLDDKKIILAKDQIAQWDKKPTVRDDLKQRLKATKPGDAAALLEIASWAKAQGLTKDSREVLDLVIKADPENADARAALGYVKFEGAWVLKKDVEAKFEAAKGEQLKGLGYKLEGGKWLSPAEISRAKAKLVQVGDYWVTPEEKQTIEAKNLEFCEGEWLAADEVEKWKKGERKIKGVFKPMLDADEAHREAKDPWALKGRYVEMRSNVRYSKCSIVFKAAEDAVNAAVKASGVEPDVWSGKGPLVVLVERDLDAFKARGHQSGSDWSSLRSNDGVFYGNNLAKGAGAAITYFFDEAYASWWGGRGGFEAYVGRITDITRLDPVLLDTFAAYFGSFVGDKYHPASSSRFLFDRTKVMRPASKMFEGFKRVGGDPAELHFRQLGFLVHFIAKKSPEGLQRAMRKFLAGNMTHRELLEVAFGKLDPAELDKDYNDVWLKFRDNFQP